MKRNHIAVLLFLLLIAIWEALVHLCNVPNYVLPAPSAVLRALVTDIPNLAGHAAVTMGETLAGLSLSLVLALILGILMDAFPKFSAAIYPLLIVTQTVPMIVLAPILILYLGFGLAPKILTVVLMCFFPIAVGFADGMREMDPQYAYLVRTYGANKLSTYFLVKIPYALPALFSGIKVAATYSVTGAVVGEWIASQSGLGYYLLRVKNSYALDKMFACVLLIILFSILMNGIVVLCGRLCMPYKYKKTRKGND